MKNLRQYFILMFLAMFPLASALWGAEMMQGVVSGIKPGDSSFTIQYGNPTSGEVEDVRIEVDANTQYRKIKSLGELQKGDNVALQVDIKKSLLGDSYTAQSLERTDQAKNG